MSRAGLPNTHLEQLGVHLSFSIWGEGRRSTLDMDRGASDILL